MRCYAGWPSGWPSVFGGKSWDSILSLVKSSRSALFPSSWKYRGKEVAVKFHQLETPKTSTPVAFNEASYLLLIPGANFKTTLRVDDFFFVNLRLRKNFPSSSMAAQRLAKDFCWTWLGDRKHFSDFLRRHFAAFQVEQKSWAPNVSLPGYGTSLMPFFYQLDKVSDGAAIIAPNFLCQVKNPESLPSHDSPHETHEYTHGKTMGLVYLLTDWSLILIPTIRVLWNVSLREFLSTQGQTIKRIVPGSQDDR